MPYLKKKKMEQHVNLHRPIKTPDVFDVPFGTSAVVVWQHGQQAAEDGLLEIGTRSHPTI